MQELLESLEERSKADPYTGFVCWDAAEVGRIMHREAAAPSRAVLLATHQPPMIRSVTVTDAGRYGSEDAVTQDALLEGVLAEGDQSLIVPVIGAAGSGKSHLVLWMRAKLDENPSPDRKVIYLPKGETSLAQVIDRILDGRTGGKFDEIREAVQNATHAMTVEEAARRLRNELALAVSAIDDAAAGPEMQQYRQHLRTHLPELLDDPVYAARLVGEGGPLRRIVEQAQTGGNEEPAELRNEDLQVQWTAVELEDLSRPAKTLLGDLQTPGLHNAAVEALNEVRDRCLSRVFGVEPMQLVGVLRELREQLFEENPNLELLLMIEDFTLLQGIQHDLLEAMIELPRREGRQVMCAMKTVMAVTRGFFDRMLVASDTLRTRIAAQGHVYDLDVGYGDGSVETVDAADVVKFTGRYLNAVRAGAEELERSAPGVPNACEHCAHREVCHDAFGTSGEEGWGLYPLNDQALDRMVRSRQAQFNPRDLLTALAQTLTEHAGELSEGRFPSDRWARRFNEREHARPQLPTLPLQTQERVNSLPKPEQRTVALKFWAGSPSELRNLRAGIHLAFDIPVVPDTDVVVPPSPKPDPGPSARPILQSDDIVEGVEQWRDGHRLNADFARTLRRVVSDAVTGALDPEGHLFSPQLLAECFDRNTAVHIENAPGNGRGAPNRFRIDFSPTNEHALLFAGILRAQREQHWSFDDAQPALIAFLNRTEAEARQLRKFLADRLEEQRSDQAGSVALLAISGLVAGQGGTNDPRALLAAALSGKTTVSETMPARWQTLVNQVGSRRDAVRAYVLQGAHVSKSTTDPAGVDGIALLPSLQKLGSDWEVPPLSEAAPQSAQTLRKILMERLEAALDEARADLQGWLEQVERLAGDPETLGERQKTWQATLEEAQAKGFLAGPRGASSDGHTLRLGPTMRVVDGLIAQWDELDLGHRIAGVAKMPWARLGPAQAHLEALEATLQASRDKAKTQEHGSGSEGASPIAAFEQALDQLDLAARTAQDA